MSPVTPVENGPATSANATSNGASLRARGLCITAGFELLLTLHVLHRLATIIAARFGSAPRCFTGRVPRLMSSPIMCPPRCAIRRCATTSLLMSHITLGAHARCQISTAHLVGSNGTRPPSVSVGGDENRRLPAGYVCTIVNMDAAWHTVGCHIASFHAGSISVMDVVSGERRHDMTAFSMVATMVPGS